MSHEGLQPQTEPEQNGRGRVKNPFGHFGPRVLNTAMRTKDGLRARVSLDGNKITSITDKVAETALPEHDGNDIHESTSTPNVQSFPPQPDTNELPKKGRFGGLKPQLNNAISQAREKIDFGRGVQKSVRADATVENFKSVPAAQVDSPDSLPSFIVDKTQGRITRKRFLNTAAAIAVATVAGSKKLKTAEHAVNIFEGINQVDAVVQKGQEAFKEHTTPALDSVGLTTDPETGKLSVKSDLLKIMQNTEMSVEDRYQQLTKTVDSLLPPGAEGETPRKDLIIGIAGTAISIGTLADIMKRDRVGVRDYLALGGINTVAALGGSDEMKKKVSENLGDTRDALEKIELVTALSSKFVQIRGSVDKPIEEDIESTDERVEEIEEEIEEKRPSLSASFDEHAAEEIESYIRSQSDKKKALRELFWLSAAVGPTFSTFASSAGLRPLIIELATNEDGTLNKEALGTFQGWIPNYLGLVAATPIGGGMGPRAAIQTLKGQDYMNQVDQQLYPFHAAATLGFTAETFYRLPKEEREGNFFKEYGKFLKDLPDYHWLVDVYKRGVQFELPGHVIRGKDHLKSFAPEFVKGIKECADESKKFVNGESSVKEVYQKFSDLDGKTYHGLREAGGHEIVEIAGVLTAQSLAVPMIETTMSWALDKTAKNLPDGLGPEFREYCVDTATYKIIDSLSAFEDNYVAVNVAQKVTDSRLKNHVKDGKSGKYSRGTVDENGNMDTEATQKLHMYYTTLGYVAGQMGGGTSPLGNTANLAGISLDEYPMQDALQPKQLLDRQAVTNAALLGLIASNKFGMMRKLSDPKFDEETQFLTA